MIRLYPDQLLTNLKASCFPCYFLFGNEPLLLQESEDYIRKEAQIQQFDEHFNVILDSNTDWEEIFNLCKTRSLFASRQTLRLILPDGNTQAVISDKLLQLTALLHNNLVLILRGSKLTPAVEKCGWFKALSPTAVLVSCSTPEKTQLPGWVARRAKKMKLALDDAACHLLCYAYEGNLLALAQALDRLLLIYPNAHLTLSQVKATVNDTSDLTLFHWINAAIMGNSKRAARVLYQLQLKTTEPVILLRIIQREVLLLLMLKRHAIIEPIYTLFERHKISQNRRSLLTNAVSRLTLSQLKDTIALMNKIERSLKQDYSYLAWSDFHALALLLCGKSIPEVMING
ncbi:DNA polymerase III subunit delta [Candidatus Steffania adelgidicola]|uniref:DNA polymerase III subunit delta n=1 Tax=Candidatus Steffania adelgidicola TaxID=1076626 RepID=UPI001D003DA6|nr:DNA polymerase III subunit delta [Candidatus Steffania adelgidicola]UDG79954.1 DNA polymerase III subunit delta [Candidatus Steffania adelgidicola]